SRSTSFHDRASTGVVRCTIHRPIGTPTYRDAALPTARRAATISAGAASPPGNGRSARLYQPRVVEIALEQVDDAVQPRRQRRLVLLDDLVGLLPLARRQMLDRSLERIAHEVLQSSWEIVVRLKSSARRRGRGCPRTTPRSRAVTLR